MKVLMTSAALVALAITLPAQAQSLGAPGAVNSAPLGAPPALPGTVGKAGGPAVPTAGDTVHGAVNGPAATAGTTADIHAPSPGAISDSRTLSTGQSVDTSANVSASGTRSEAMLTGGMAITDMSGMPLGRVVSVGKTSAGKVSRVVIQTADGVSRIMPPANLTVKGSAAVTSQSLADLTALPVAK
jgi:hypothetical protein